VSAAVLATSAKESADALERFAEWLALGYAWPPSKDEIRLANEIIKRARAALEIHRAAGVATSEESARCARGCLLRVYEP